MFSYRFDEHKICSSSYLFYLIVELYIIVFVEIKYKMLIAFLQKYLRATIG